MRLLIKDRGKGKTTQMIYTSEATGYPIVVRTRCEVNYLIEKAKKMDVIIPEPIIINDIRKGNYLKSKMIGKVLIDEGYDIIEAALKEYIGCEVESVTITDRIKEEKQLVEQNKIKF